MEKVAIIADVHANIYALNTFLEYVDQNQINKILNLGDFVQIGPNPSEVVDIILNDKRFINIIGNNEISLFNINEQEKSNENNHRIWTKKQLGDKMYAIKEVSQTQNITLENLKILMTHSTKNKNKQMSNYKENVGKFARKYKKFNYDTVLFGHTHEKKYIEHKNKTYINPGSLGCSKNFTVNFAIIEIEEDRLENCIFKSIKYDNTKLIEDYTKNEVPDKEFILKTFYGYKIEK